MVAPRKGKIEGRPSRETFDVELRREEIRIAFVELRGAAYDASLSITKADVAFCPGDLEWPARRAADRKANVTSINIRRLPFSYKWRSGGRVGNCVTGSAIARIAKRLRIFVRIFPPLRCVERIAFMWIPPVIDVSINDCSAS